MAIETDFKSLVLEKLLEFEGAVPHLYQDSVGKVTVGIGHLVPSRMAVQHVDLRRCSTPPTKANTTAAEGDPRATDPEKLADYDAVAKLAKGLGWRKYTSSTKLRMTRTGMLLLTEEHYNRFLADLRRIYKKSAGYPADFDDLPKEVRLALFDMIYNLGPGGVTNTFKKFDKAVKAGDWKEAAKQSHRFQVQKERNDYVRDLFTKAAASVQTGGVNVPSGVTLPAPGVPAPH